MKPMFRYFSTAMQKEYVPTKYSKYNLESFKTFLVNKKLTAWLGSENMRDVYDLPNIQKQW